ncbi:hypothetical protein EB241_05345 [Erwinia psidii]|uniref:Uncharacterized protein n=1 Tax=Erwinia psidii TaxID=69224 RepID=A0A3N6SCP3_9GAMM|nr:hypothetical protein EB241_05345 [Erwinia psidii]
MLIIFLLISFVSLGGSQACHKFLSFATAGWSGLFCRHHPILAWDAGEQADDGVQHHRRLNRLRSTGYRVSYRN